MALAMAGADYFEAVWSARPEDGELPDFAARRALLLAHADPGELVLDLGCGAGEFAAALAQAGRRVVAVDVAPEALRRARARHPGLDLRLAPPSGPLPVGDTEVDVVWASEVIEHVLDTAAWLSEVRRVLRPAGRLLITTPYHGRLATVGLGLRRSAFDAHFDPRSDHLRFYSASSLRALLEDFGFEVRRLRPRGGVPGLRRSLDAVARRRRW